MSTAQLPYIAAQRAEDEAFWQATALRERVGADYDAVYYSTVQRIFQLALFKQRRESAVERTVTNDEISREYNAKVQVSSGEAVSGAFVETAFTVYERLLLDDEARSDVLWALGPACRLPAGVLADPGSSAPLALLKLRPKRPSARRRRGTRSTSLATSVAKLGAAAFRLSTKSGGL